MIRVFHLLESYGLAGTGYLKRIGSWKPGQMLDFLEQIGTELSAVHKHSAARNSYIANGPMSGDATRCSDFECRTKSLMHTARFAALYADKVLILDPFEQFHGIEVIDATIFREVAFAIRLMQLIRPVAEANLIGLAPDKVSLCLCKDCSRKYKSKTNKIEKASNALSDLFLDNISVIFQKSKIANFVEFIVSGPERLVEHGSKAFLTRPDNSILDFLTSRRRHRLSRNEIIETGILLKLVAPILNDLFTQNAYASHRFSFLTDRDIDLEVLAAINDPKIQKRSAAMFDGLSHSIPILPEAKLSSLVKLRSREGESFQVYRDKLNSIIQLLEAEGKLTKNQVRDAFRDILEPELNRLDQAVRANKTLLFGRVKKDVVLGAGVITAGLFAGVLPREIGALVASIGGFSYAKNILENLTSLREDSASIRTNCAYFLWKARAASRE